MPALSVIIPTYNRPDFVVNCVNTLQNCGVDDLEIIVVDDGSTDNTREVVTGIPVCRYLHQKNQGPATARNYGFSESKGEFVAFVDSDDGWDEGAAAAVLQKFYQYPKVDLIFSDARMGNEADGFQSWIQIAGEETFWELPSQDDSDGFRLLDQLSFFRRMIVRNAVFISTTIMRRTAFESTGGFNPGLCGAADWDLWLRMASQLQFGFCPNPLGIYTRHDDCMSNDHDEMRVDFIRALENVKEKCTHLSVSEIQLLDRQIHHHMFNHAYTAYDEADLPLARSRLQELAARFGLSNRERLIYCATFFPTLLVTAARRLKNTVS